MIPDGVICIVCKTVISKRVKWRLVAYRAGAAHRDGSADTYDLIFYAAAHERCADGEEAWQAEHPLRPPPTRRRRSVKHAPTSQSRPG